MLGVIIVSVGGEILVILRNGSIYFPQTDLLFDGLISDYVKPVRRAFYRDVVRLCKDSKWDPEGHDDEYPQRFFNFCLSRILTSIRDKGHGGTLLLVPNELSVSDSRLADRVTIKYPCAYDYIWKLMMDHLVLHRRYFEMHFAMWDSKVPIDPKQYQSISSCENDREEIDEALADCFRLIGSLSSVDGAVVMTDHLRVLGFGAEVIALSPTLKYVNLASDARARSTRAVSIESYGTRHRSAFRFCSSYEYSVAFIVSQDGGVRAAKRSGPDVIFWPDVNMGSLGL